MGGVWEMRNVGMASDGSDMEAVVHDRVDGT